MKIAVFTQMFNEELYIQDWLNYHINACSINRFYVANNQSTDRTKEILLANSPVTTWDVDVHKCGAPGCWEPLKEAHRRAAADGMDWIIFLDVDEFIHYSDHEYGFPLHDVLQGIPDDVGAVTLNWKLYTGKEDIVRPVTDHVLNRFHYWSPNMHVKSLCRVGCVDLSRIPDPHFIPVLPGYKAQSVDGRPANGPFMWPACYNELWINHYHFKSRAEYLIKLRKGTIDGNIRDESMIGAWDEACAASTIYE